MPRIESHTLEYLTRAFAAVEKGDFDESIDEFTECTECDQSFFSILDADLESHTYTNRNGKYVILIGCEGFYSLAEYI